MQYMKSDELKATVDLVFKRGRYSINEMSYVWQYIAQFIRRRVKVV